MIIGGYRVETLAKRVAAEVVEDNVLGLAAQTAYYFFFSLFPILLFLAPLLSVVGDKRETLGFLLGELQQTVPPDAYRLLDDVVQSVVFSEGAPGLMSLGAVLALWAGSNVFNALIGALNRAYDVEEGRPWWKSRLIAIGMVVISGVVLMLATVTFIGGERIVRWAAGILGLGATATLIWTIAQYVVVFAVLVALAWLQYYILPSVRQSKRHVLVGAVLTTLLWVLVTLAFRAYVVNFGNYNATYGTIGGVIALLTWMYLSMVVLLVGGELNSELHKGTGSIARRAGTLYGDRVGTGGAAVLPSVERVGRVEPYARARS